MKVLICGDRNWSDEDMIRRDIEELYQEHGDELHIINGGAKGADHIAKNLALNMGIRVSTFPAEWKRYGRAAGPIRNQEMLDEKPEQVRAYHDFIQNSRGTKDMVERAKKANVPTIIRAHA